MKDSPDINSAAVTMVPTIGIAAIALVLLLFSVILLFEFINVSEMTLNLTISVQKDVSLINRSSSFDKKIRSGL
jgi:hypothetical protein